LAQLVRKCREITLKKTQATDGLIEHVEVVRGEALAEAGIGAGSKALIADLLRKGYVTEQQVSVHEKETWQS
jgi:hypothetical protein